MRSSRFIPAVAALALVALPAISLAQTTETETVERTLRLQTDGVVTLKNFSGDITVRGSSGNDVVIKAVRRATRDRLDNIKLDITESGSTIAIEANKRSADWNDRDNNIVETTFDIEVPARARLEIDAFSSDVTVMGVTGAQKLKTFSGDISVDGARGELNLKSFDGSIDADLRGAGDRPGLTAETFSGGIEARLSDNARGRIDFSSFSGSLESDLPLSNQSKSKRNVKADLPGGSGDTLKFKTFSGELRIRR